MQNIQFITDAQLLEKGLFSPYTSRNGAQTSLNINYIPDLLAYVKSQMTSEELLRL